MIVRALAIATLCAVAVGMAATPPPARAQGAPDFSTPALPQGAATPNGVPLRNGNIWNGLPHQPDASVDSQEQAAGVLPSQQRIDKENQELDALDRKLLEQHGVKP
ncbi:hypothetical protein [Acidisphaera rubrifaciens]|uniref:Uncharacterized protein n=1 Tax=Acidisphaera rubrifaciens HS-AP3 TaxID=1231350 RepID=A0A0D6PB14_9PROT|nr:hypothetical protein [Acidisphaera rubrifaciens]GAN78388.1 hypothetical protein Asru_0807_02 [Acidisphaera rubrifaciens HS-AP3]